MNSAWKIIGGVVLLFALILVAFSYKDVLPFFSGTASERLESLWKRDLIALADSKSLPESFLSIKDISYSFGSKTAEEWVKNIQAPLKEKPNGNFHLDVFVDHWTEGKEYGVVIQYQLVDLASKNTIWELGRTLALGERDDLIPEKPTEALKTPSPSTTK